MVCVGIGLAALWLIPEPPRCTSKCIHHHEKKIPPPLPPRYPPDDDFKFTKLGD